MRKLKPTEVKKLVSDLWIFGDGLRAQTQDSNVWVLTHYVILSSLRTSREKVQDMITAHKTLTVLLRIDKSLRNQ